MSLFTAIQEQIRERLDEHEDFAAIPVVTEDRQTITTEIAESLAASGLAENPEGKVGLAIVLTTPAFEAESPEADALVLGLTVIISVYENTVINQGATGTGTPALEVVESICRQLHAWRPERGLDPVRVLGMESEEANGVVVYHLRARTARVLSPEENQ